jgi:quinohemoprotein ethanol dehydrogenase
MGLTICLAATAASMPMVGTGADWPNHGGGVDETGYSQLNQITTANATKLGLAWSLDLPGEASLEATPLAIKGVLYFTGSYAAVYAVDGATGKLLWKYDPQVWKNNPGRMAQGFGANMGVAYANGRIFAGSIDGTLFALAAKTGKLLWSVDTALSPGQAIKSAPRVFKDKVIVGNTGADFGARGYVTAYEQATGKQAWRFFTVPGSPEQNLGDPVMEKIAGTWTGEYWKTGTGGSVWAHITYDQEFNRVYLGTANAGPYDPAKRSPGGGDNLFTASIVALDADTGKYAWHYQINPRDAWDFDCMQQMTLATLTIDGKPRKVVMQAPKNGFFYVIDRQDGKLISAGKLGKINWAERIDIASGRPVENPGIRYENGEFTIWPGTFGAHSWQDQSYSPRTGLVYLPYMQAGTRFYTTQQQPQDLGFGGLNIGTAKNTDPMDGKGALIAWDPVRQKPAWSVWQETLWNGGALSTAGDVVFNGSADGYFTAYDARNGQRLWRIGTGGGIIAAPMSYQVGTTQYVSILVGYGAQAAIGSDLMNTGWKYSAPRRLLTFALNGKARLAPAPPRTMKINALDDPSLEIKPADVAMGHAMSMACATCHGKELVGAGGPAPDLRESALALNFDTFWTVVHDGALMSKGMPKFSFSREQVQALHAYIRQGAREALAAQPAKK